MVTFVMTATRYDMQEKELAKFVTLLGNVARNLFTFVNYPGIELTNKSECMLRNVVIYHRMKYRLASTIDAFASTLMMCLLIWIKRKLNVSEYCTSHQDLNCYEDNIYMIYKTTCDFFILWQRCMMCHQIC